MYVYVYTYIYIYIYIRLHSTHIDRYITPKIVLVFAYTYLMLLSVFIS